VADVAADGQLPGVFCTAAAVDPATWQLVHFTLWAQSAPEWPGERYEVLHTSSPYLADLLTGRHW